MVQHCSKSILVLLVAASGVSISLADSSGGLGFGGKRKDFSKLIENSKLISKEVHEAILNDESTITDGSIVTEFQLQTGGCDGDLTEVTGYLLGRCIPQSGIIWESCSEDSDTKTVTQTFSFCDSDCVSNCQPYTSTVPVCNDASSVTTSCTTNTEAWTDYPSLSYVYNYFYPTDEALSCSPSDLAFFVAMPSCTSPDISCNGSNGTFFNGTCFRE